MQSADHSVHPSRPCAVHVRAAVQWHAHLQRSLGHVEPPLSRLQQLAVAPVLLERLHVKLVLHLAFHRHTA